MKHLAHPLSPRRIHQRTSRPSAQRGIATVLSMTLVGMALTASVLGTAYYIHGRQHQSMTTHAQTQAQLNAWTGAHIVQSYLDALHSQGDLQKFMELSTTPPVQLELTGADVNGLVHAQITQFNPQATPPTIVATITGNTAQGTRAQASALLEVVYEIHAAKAPETCQAQTPRASVMVRGDLKITGGSSGFESASGLLDIIVDGSLEIAQASQASFSGCAKGDIRIDGGGIKSGGKVHSETGTIHFKVMTPPNNADVWGNAITMDQFGKGNFSSIRAGAYKVDLVDASGSLQNLQAFMGGKLLAYTAYGGPQLAQGALPWRMGTLVPPTQGQVVLYQQGKAQWLLDLSQASIDTTTGKISNIRKAAEALDANAAPLPDTLYAYAQDVHAGAITMYEHTASELWGNRIELKANNGSYQATKAAADLKVHLSSLGEVIVGGDFIATESDRANLKSNLKFTRATVAGTFRDKSGSAFTDAASLFPQLQQNRPTTSPGLPGRPYCEARMHTLRVEPYKAHANYVFEYVQGVPKVTIQGVKDRITGQSIDGVYDLNAPIVKKLMSCNWTDTGSCEQGSNQIAQRSWLFHGMKRFPVGTVWFDGDVTFNPDFKGMHNTILTQGNLVLGNDIKVENKILKSPSHAGLKAMCQTPAHIPSALCEQLQQASTNTQSAESADDMHTLLSHMAVMTEKDLTSNGWTMHGNVQIGRGLNNGANSSTVYGTVAIGLNDASKGVSLSNGGLIVKTNQVSNTQLTQPGEACSNNGTNSGASGGSGSHSAGNSSGQAEDAAGVTRIKWSRYL